MGQKNGVKDEMEDVRVIFKLEVSHARRQE